VPGKAGKTRELKCATCHAVSAEGTDTNKFPGPDLEKYPEAAKLATSGTKVNHIGFVKAHSSCNECHNQLAKGGILWNCGNCHGISAPMRDPTLREFPNPAAQLSQFADKYTHKDHSGSKCSECHDVGPKGGAQLLPQHKECFVCHSYAKDAQPPLATDCTGCHANMAENKPTVDAKLKPPRNPINAVAVELLAPRTFVTPAAPKPAFNHVGGAAKYHEVLKPDTGPSAGKTLEGKAACVFCHTSATRATSRDQMQLFAAKKDAPAQALPPGTACVVCHVHAEQMAPPEKVTKLTTAKCLGCHTAAVAARPAPESHMRMGAAAPARPPTM
jgi:hypothetical protein